MISLIQPSVARVVVVSRSPRLSADTARWLADDVTSVVHCTDLSRLLADERPDVVVVDRALLGDVGAELRRLRRRWLTVTIIVVGAANDSDIARLLDAGADDAVALGSSVLAARLHALTRRARTVNAGTRIAVGDIMFDRESRRVWCAGREVALTRTEEALLDCLFWYVPRPVSTVTIAEFVWGLDVTPARRRLIRVYVGYLRTKLTASARVEIRTVRGTGYQFSAR